MKKPVSIQISIPDPCQQDWNNMQRGGKGLYCSDCKKTVVDFTKMSDAQIIAFLQREKLSCGLFRKNQLEREINSPIINMAQFGAKWMLGFLLFFGWMKEGKAQQKNIVRQDTHQSPAVRQKSVSTHVDDTTESHADTKAQPALMQESHNDYNRVVGGIPPQEFDMNIPIGNNRGKLLTRLFSIPQSLNTPTSFGGRSTRYIVDGVKINPESAIYTTTHKVSLWRRVHFWKKQHQ